MRLFLGIDIPTEIKCAIKADATIFEGISTGKYVREDMYHITLAYIGESDEFMLEKASEAASFCAAKVQEFELASAELDYFGKREKSILHYAIKPSFELLRLSDMLRAKLTESALPFDPKPLCPHITLARNVNATSELLAAPHETYKFVVNAITLFNSCRIDDKLCYVPIENFSLSV